MSARNRGSVLKNPFAIIAILVVLGGAGYVAYSRYQQGAVLDDGEAKLTAARMWQLKFSRDVINKDVYRFGRVQLGVRPDMTDKGDHYIEIGGAVQTQADLDMIDGFLKQEQYAPPVRVERTLVVHKIEVPNDLSTSPGPGGRGARDGD